MSRERLSRQIYKIFVLERFTDFTLNTSVAPIREAAARLLGVLYPHLSDGQTQSFCGHLLDLAVSDQWPIRHAGMLGLGYLVAAQQDRLGKASLHKITEVSLERCDAQEVLNNLSDIGPG